jgi:hypothetical protein
MSDPNELAAEQIRQHAAQVQGDTAAPDADLAAQLQQGQGQASIGVTEADITSLFAQIKAMQDRLDKAERERASSAPPALVSTAETLKGYVDVHGDPVAAELAADAVEAARNATDSGDTGPLAKIQAKLAKHLARNPPYPGENHHYRQALDWAANHLDDAIEAFVPPARSSAVAVTSDRAPAKVVEGSVVG